MTRLLQYQILFLFSWFTISTKRYWKAKTSKPLQWQYRWQMDWNTNPITWKRILIRDLVYYTVPHPGRKTSAVALYQRSSKNESLNLGSFKELRWTYSQLQRNAKHDDHNLRLKVAFLYRLPWARILHQLNADTWILMLRMKRQGGSCWSCCYASVLLILGYEDLFVNGWRPRLVVVMTAFHRREVIAYFSNSEAR